MIGHIFRKDLLRLWPFVLGLAAVHFALAFMRVTLGPFPEDHRALQQATDLLNLGAYLLLFFTAVMAVQLDPLTDDRQDWLVRPIRRRDLLLAKLAFVLVLLHGPLLIAGLVQGLAMGFPFGQALAAAFWWCLYQFVGFSLLAMAVAALTRSIGQTLGAMLAAGLAAVAVVGGILWSRYALTGNGMASEGTLASWLLNYGLLFTGAAVILGLQYFRRATFKSRAALGVFAVLAALTALLPQSAGLAVQSWFWPAGLSVAFAPEAGRATATAEDAAPDRRPDAPVRLALPLRLAGVAPGTMLVGESVKLTLIAPDGTRTETYPSRDTLLRSPGQPDAPFHQSLPVPLGFYRAHSSEPVRVEPEYMLGVFTPLSSRTMAVKNGDAWFPEGAYCRSRLHPSGTGVQLGCLQAGHVHSRISAALAGAVPVTDIRHLPSDAPWSNGSDMITQFVLDLPLQGRDAAQSSTLNVTMSRSQAHVVRRVVIENVRLNAWTPIGR